MFEISAARSNKKMLGLHKFHDESKTASRLGL